MYLLFVDAVILQAFRSDEDHLPHARLSCPEFRKTKHLAEPAWDRMRLGSGTLHAHDAIGMVRWDTPPKVDCVEGDKGRLFESAQKRGDCFVLDHSAWSQLLDDEDGAAIPA